MNIYQRWKELNTCCKENEVVECHDATHGTVYKEIGDLPVVVAEQPAKYAYFRFKPKGVAK